MKPVRTNFENSKDQLRRYYSKSLFPVLKGLEKKRKKLLLLLLLSGLMLIFSLIWWLANQQFLLALLIFVFGLVPSFLFSSKIREFKASFKHIVIHKLMEFFELQNLLHSIQYEPYGKISKVIFLKSNFVMEEIVEYNSEDYFKGRTHDTAFEICELKVKTKSKVTGKIKIAFRGHFLKFNPNRNHEGKIWILPKTEKSNLTNSIKEMYRLGAKPIEDTVLSRRYLIYHTPEFILNHFLTDDLKKVLEDWANQNRTFFIYSEGPDIHVAIRNSMDILEPNIFTSNKRFDKILNLHQELSNMFEIIESFEKGV